MKTAALKSQDSTHSSHPFLNGTDTPFFGPQTIQPKLKIGQPNDKYEQQADRVADAVMQHDSPIQMQAMEEEEELQMQPLEEEEELQMKNHAADIQQKCEGCEHEEQLQKSAEVKAPGSGESFATRELSSQLTSFAGSGSSLAEQVQSEMQNKMGADFSGVNIHTDSQAVQLNRQLGAKAFTHGRDIYFDKGRYNPASSSGKHLLAHELTHVVQQRGEGIKVQRACSNDSWQYEYDGCSLPPTVANIIGAEHKDNPAGGTDTQFALPDGSKDRPCDRHDECYQTCHRDPAARLMCDWRMYSDMLNVCKNSRESEDVKKECRKYAWIYFNGLMDFATTAFIERQQQVCACVGGGFPTEVYLPGFQFPLGVTIPIGENAMINAGGGTFRPPEISGGEASLAAGGQFIWRF
jgi:hypothetical protein